MDAWYQRAQRSPPGRMGHRDRRPVAGRCCGACNPDEPLMPASTVKLFTTGFARSVLGGTARRPTRVVGVGSLDSVTGEWIGSWALEVNGDPSLERGRRLGPDALRSRHAARQRGGAQAHRSAAAAELRTGRPTRSIRRSGRSATRVGSSRRWSGRSPCTRTSSGSRCSPGARVGQRVRGDRDGAGRHRAPWSTVTATTRSGRRSRLALAPRADGGWVVTGTIGVRAAPRRLTAVAARPARRC